MSKEYIFISGLLDSAEAKLNALKGDWQVEHMTVLRDLLSNSAMPIVLLSRSKKVDTGKVVDTIRKGKKLKR
jgi:cbb3-type cytochrome oxidase cytochrome c subunit